MYGELKKAQELFKNENGEYEFKDKKTYLWRKDGYGRTG